MKLIKELQGLSEGKESKEEEAKNAEAILNHVKKMFDARTFDEWFNENGMYTASHYYGSDANVISSKIKGNELLVNIEIEGEGGEITPFEGLDDDVTEVPLNISAVISIPLDTKATDKDILSKVSAVNIDITEYLQRPSSENENENDD